MKVTARFFASARDAAGIERQPLELGEGATVADAALALRNLLPAASQIVQSSAFAVNQRFARADHTLREGDELAILPPVSGG